MIVTYYSSSTSLFYCSNPGTMSVLIMVVMMNLNPNYVIGINERLFLYQVKRHGIRTCMFTIMTWEIDFYDP